MNTGWEILIESHFSRKLVAPKNTKVGKNSVIILFVNTVLLDSASKNFRSHLNSDMKDPELKFWTTKPSVFLVAITESGKVVECILYRQINNNKFEMHRLAVDEDLYKLIVGQRLVLL